MGRQGQRRMSRVQAGRRRAATASGGALWARAPPPRRLRGGDRGPRPPARKGGHACL